MAGEKKGRDGNFKELSLVIWSWILGGVCFTSALSAVGDVRRGIVQDEGSLCSTKVWGRRWREGC